MMFEGLTSAADRPGSLVGCGRSDDVLLGLSCGEKDDCTARCALSTGQIGSGAEAVSFEAHSFRRDSISIRRPRRDLVIG